MFFGNLKRFVDALLDRDGRHDNHELREAVALVQFKDRAQVRIRLAGSRLHFDGEVAGVQSVGRRYAVPELDSIQVLEDFLVE